MFIYSTFLLCEKVQIVWSRLESGPDDYVYGVPFISEYIFNELGQTGIKARIFPSSAFQNKRQLHFGFLEDGGRLQK